MKWDKDIDKIFAEGFESFEPGMYDGDWQKMASLLDEEKKGFFLFWSRIKTKFNHKKALIMISILAIIGTGVSLMMGGNTQKSTNKFGHLKTIKTLETKVKTKEKKRHNTADFNSQILTKNEKNGSIGDETIRNTSISGTNKGHGLAKGQKMAAKPAVRTTAGTRRGKTNTSMEDLGNSPTTQAISSTAGLTSPLPIDTTIYKSGSIVRYRRYEHKEYEYYDCFIDQAKPIQDFWFGFYYNQQQLQKDSSISHGFNIQFMSGNLVKNNRWGIYGGLDWGMQFYGRTPNENIALNTVNGDSGYTRLRNNAMDFVLKGQLEYNTKYIAPYITAGAGPRIYYTGQKVKSYVPLKDVESSDRHGLATRVSMVYNVGVGARIKVAPRVAIDLRYDITRGQKTEVMDLQQTTFNGLKYNEVLKDYNPNYHSFRIGVTLDVSETRCKERKLISSEWRSVVLDSTVIKNISDSSIVVLPCPTCPCEKQGTINKNEIIDRQEMEQEENTKDEQKSKRGVSLWDILNSGNTGSEGISKPSKGSFPGIKAPPTIKH